MGLLTGTMNGCFYKTTHPEIMANAHAVQAWLHERVLTIIRAAFKPIDTTRGELSSRGLVTVDDLLKPAAPENVLFGDMVSPVIAFGVREDKIRIDKKVFLARLKAEICAFMELNGERINKEERLIIEDRVRMAMIHAAQPASKVTDVAWDTTTGLIWIGAASVRAAEDIAAMIKEAFGIELERVTVITEAARFLAPSGLIDRLANAMPTNLNSNLEDIFEVTREH